MRPRAAVRVLGAKVGLLSGPDPQQVTITGTTSDGDPAEFELTLP